MQNERLSAPEAARIGNVTVASIYHWIDRGELAAETEWRGSQRRCYVSREALMALLAAKREGRG